LLFNRFHEKHRTDFILFCKEKKINLKKKKKKEKKEKRGKRPETA
jgi:hypothetical protein